MPVYCVAFGCYNRRNTETRSRGITFHKFPSNIDLRRQWEFAIKRERFVASQSSKLCSEHFEPDDFDRTGQILKAVQLTSKHTSTHTLPFSLTLIHFLILTMLALILQDHSYALPDSPTHLKARLREALRKMESLEREKLNAEARERRAQKTIKILLEDLKKKNLINEELKEKLDFYSGKINL
uniref:Si:ch73-130a3.4 n=1 Tax=Astyanax mexicanus TaxID=7994 RepID=W5LJE0_ASTMX